MPRAVRVVDRVLARTPSSPRAARRRQATMRHEHAEMANRVRRCRAARVSSVGSPSRRWSYANILERQSRLVVCCYAPRSSRWAGTRMSAAVSSSSERLALRRDRRGAPRRARSWRAPARADSPFDGKWKQGPLREEYTVQQWLPGCGPAPVIGEDRRRRDRQHPRGRRRALVHRRRPRVQARTNATTRSRRSRATPTRATRPVGRGGRAARRRRVRSAPRAHADARRPRRATRTSTSSRPAATRSR